MCTGVSEEIPASIVRLDNGSGEGHSFVWNAANMNEATQRDIPHGTLKPKLAEHKLKVTRT
jgi:hypothetical protein